MFSFFKKQQSPIQAFMISELYDENTFYNKFVSDLYSCQSEVIIESPFITLNRMNILFPVFEMLIERGVRIYIVTRDPSEHTDLFAEQAEAVIQQFENMGVHVLICRGNHHRKLAILDREILWEGSLNILSQDNSREIMRRIPKKQIALQMFSFLKYYRFL